MPLALKLPAPAFKGTPKDLQLGPNVEPLSDKPRPPMMVPAGLKNLAPGSKITCSDKNVTADSLAKLTDGDKDASDQSIIFLRKGTQWVQLDLGSPQEIFAVVIWHAHNMAKVYHDIIVQVADDADFIENVRTIFNNDRTTPPAWASAPIASTSRPTKASSSTPKASRPATFVSTPRAAPRAP